MAPLAPWLHLWLQEKNEKERTVLTWCFFQSQKARNNATLTKTAELRWKATLSVLDATFVVVKKFPANKDCLLKLCMVVKSASTIGVGAGKFLVVRRNFARILTTFPKKSNKSDRQKKEESSSCQFGRHFLQVKACWAPFLLKFSGSLWRFSEILPGFCGILPGFYGILPGFSPNQNFWGCGCTPASLPPTPVASTVSWEFYLEKRVYTGLTWWLAEGVATTLFYANLSSCCLPSAYRIRYIED